MRSLPLIQIAPASGLSSPTSVLRNTDFPVPEGPSITLISPAGSVSVTSFQMVWDPKRFVRPSTCDGSTSEGWGPLPRALLTGLPSISTSTTLFVTVMSPGMLELSWMPEDAMLASVL